MIHKRDFITLLGAAAAWPLAAKAQQAGRMQRIGVLLPSAANDPESMSRVTAFLQELGWTDGRNVRIDFRWGAGDAEQYGKIASDLIALAPDVVLTLGTLSVKALQRATRTVPIVFAQTTDPVGGGLVESLARLGGNVTGFAAPEFQTSGKYVE